MKKIIILLCSVALIVILCTTVPAVKISADSPSPVLSIDYCNLSFRSSVCIKYAVYSENADEVKVLIWNEAQDSYEYGTHDAELSSVGKETINGQSYLVFDYTELAAKQMTDTVYARAYTNSSGNDCYSEINEYSVLQYAYNKLGKTGTASTDENLKAMLRSMLSYGAAAQIYFDYKTDTLATDGFYQINVSGGTIEGGATSGLYVAGDKLNLNASVADSDGNLFSRWTDSDGNTLSTNRSFTVTVADSNETYTALYEYEPTEGLKFVSNGDGTCTYWSHGTSNATDIVIPHISPEGDIVTSIGGGSKGYVIIDGERYYFRNPGWEDIDQGCGYTSIIMPDTVTEMPSHAFVFGHDLKTVILSDSMTEIPIAAFEGCTGLEYIEIPNSITTIKSAFFGCRSLTELYIPASVTYIEVGYTFTDCISMTKYEVDPENKCYKSIDGNIYSIDGTVLYQYAAGKEASEFTTPDCVTKVSGPAFSNCQSLTSVVFSESVTEVGFYAFEDCSNLTSITFLNSNTEIAERMIGCECSNDCNTKIPIYGYTGSTAEAYAAENDLPFVAID